MPIKELLKSLVEIPSIAPKEKEISLSVERELMYRLVEGTEEHLPIVFGLEKKIFEPNLQASEEVIRERFKRYNG